MDYKRIAKLAGVEIEEKYIDIKWFFDEKVFNTYNLDENNLDKYSIKSDEVDKFVNQMLSNNIEDIKLTIEILNNCNVNIYYNYVFNLLRKSEIWKLDWWLDWNTLKQRVSFLKRRFHYD